MPANVVQAVVARTERSASGAYLMLMGSIGRPEQLTMMCERESITFPLMGGVCVLDLDGCQASALGATLLVPGLKAEVGGGRAWSAAHRSSSPPV